MKQIIFKCRDRQWDSTKPPFKNGGIPLDFKGETGLKLLKKGAEAELLEAKFGGKKCLLKRRVRKGYRPEKLDLAIRKKRTRSEANLIFQARSLGVNVPRIFETDEKNCEIKMEFIGGKRAKDFLNGKNLKKICAMIGKNIAKLHNYGLIHGDLTTSNILVKSNELYFIDFGLAFNSKKLEDKAVDLLNLKKTYNATHCRLPKGWQCILQGYLKEGGEKQAIRQIAEIEKRARYY